MILYHVIECFKIYYYDEMTTKAGKKYHINTDNDEYIIIGDENADERRMITDDDE